MALLTAACSPRPFVVDSPNNAVPNRPQSERELGPHDYDPRPRPISLCYSSQLNTPQEVIERARELCPNNGSLRFHSEDALFNACALFQPFRVTFICTPGEPPPSPYE